MKAIQSTPDQGVEAPEHSESLCQCPECFSSDIIDRGQSLILKKRRIKYCNNCSFNFWY